MLKFKKIILSFLILFGALIFLSSCSGGKDSVTPSNFGSQAGVDGAKYWKQNNPGMVASTESAAAFCASMAEEGGKMYGWGVSDVLKAADSCSISFTTELFRK